MAQFRERAFKALATLLPERKERVTEIHYITNAEIHYHIDRVNITVKEGSVSNTTTTIIGNQNFGQQIAELIVGIQGNVATLLKNTDTEDVGKALEALTAAIKKEPGLADDKRTAVLQQVNFLGQQAAMPVEKRQGGLLKPIIDTVSGICAGVGGLAAAWVTWGPVITKFFGL